MLRKELPVIESEVPIACSLDAASLEERKARFRELADVAFIRLEDRGAAFDLYFRNTEGVARELSELTELEKQCCPFFGFDLSAGLEEIRVTVTAPGEARAALEDLVRVFGSLRR